jgi:hypothetical protein
LACDPRYKEVQVKKAGAVLWYTVFIVPAVVCTLGMFLVPPLFVPALLFGWLAHLPMIKKWNRQAVAAGQAAVEEMAQKDSLESVDYDMSLDYDEEDE